MHICRTLDVDGSGFLDLKEFLLAIELVAARTPEDKLLWAFRQYDTDNSGCVDRGVFKKYVDFLSARKRSLLEIVFFFVGH